MANVVVSAWQSLVVSFGQLVQSWWRQDRIRVGRNCGQMLTLVVGNRLLIADDIFMIMQRTTDALPVERLSARFAKQPLTVRNDYAYRDTHKPNLAHDTAVVDRAANADLYDENVYAAAPTQVVYLLRCFSDGAEGQWYALDDEASMSLGEKRDCNEATLIVPIAPKETIRFIQGTYQRELLAEEITILSSS